MKVAISFLSTQFHILRNHWEKNTKYKSHTGTGVGLGGITANQIGIEPFIGGKVIILNWPEMNIIWEMDIDGAAGFAIEDETLTVCNMRLNYILQINMSTKGEINRIYHPAFNCLHSLSKTQSGYLLSSTGTDLIIEVDRKGRALFEWWACEQGYNILPNGEIRTLLKDMPHKDYVYPTLHQTTHVNSAYQTNNYILTTFFHQGTLVKINKESLESRVLLSGLSCPHGIKKIHPGNWAISDTKNNRVLILDSHFNIKDELCGDFDWVQDQCPTKDGSILIADANNNRIVEMCPKTKATLNEFNFSKEWRIYQVSVI